METEVGKERPLISGISFYNFSRKRHQGKSKDFAFLGNCPFFSTTQSIKKQMHKSKEEKESYQRTVEFLSREKYVKGIIKLLGRTTAVDLST